MIDSDALNRKSTIITSPQQGQYYRKYSYKYFTRLLLILSIKLCCNNFPIGKLFTKMLNVKLHNKLVFFANAI